MATIEPRTRADGTTAYLVRWREETGRQRSRTFDRRRDAAAFLTTIDHELLTGTYVDRSLGRQTVQSWAEEWRIGQVWAPSTAERVESVFRNHLYPVLGDYPIGAVRRSHVQTLISKMSKGLAPATVHSAYGHITAMFRAAELDRMIGRSPCEQITLPTVSKSQIVPPTTDQVALLAEALGDRWAPMVWTMAGTGLRISELLGLTADAVNFLGRELRVERQSVPVAGGGATLSSRLKTPSSHRTIPLPDSIGLVLSHQIEVNGVGAERVIFHHDGRIRVRGSLSDAIKRAVARTDGLPDTFTSHDLRHYYTSMLIRDGASVKVIQARLGHASAVETLDTYAHLWPDDDDSTRSAVETHLAPVIPLVAASSS